MIKAVIPVAGTGTMLRPHTHTQPKPLVPVAGKPILSHIIESLIEVGITDFVFIIGYLGEKIELFVKDRYQNQINAEFVVQAPRKGLGHAIWTAREQIKGTEEILIILGDTILDVDLKHILSLPESVIGVQPVPDPRKFGVAEVDEQFNVKRLIEKPKIPKSNLALVGLYKIKSIPPLIEALESMIKKNNREEFHLTDGLMGLIDSHKPLKAFRVDNWFDCGKKETLLQANKILLERVEKNPTYTFENTVIHHPVHIARGCIIKDSIIGPYVAIGENASIERSILRNAIIGEYASLESIILDTSVVGNDGSLKGDALSVNIGDNTEIDFST